MSGSATTFKPFLFAAVCALSLLEVPASAAIANVSFSASTVIFNTMAGTTAPAQQVGIISDQNVVLSAVSVQYSDPAFAGWLAVSPLPGPGGVALTAGVPLTLTLGVNNSIVPDGNYTAQILVNTAGPANLPMPVTVYMNVTGNSGSGNLGETMTVTPANVSFVFQPGGAVPAGQVLSVATSDNMPVTATPNTDSGQPWLLVTGAITTPGNLTVSVNPSGLASGTYTGNVTIVAPNTLTRVPVTLTVGSVGFSTSTTSITINEPQSYGLSANFPLIVTASTPTAFSVQTSTTDPGRWLQADVANATTPATVNIRASDSSLQQGTYTGTVTLAAGPSNVVTIPVTLNVGPPATLSIGPSSLNFTYSIGGPTPATQLSKVNSLISSSQTFTVAATTSDGSNWLLPTASPSTTPGMVNVVVNPANLAVGTYTGVVNVTPTTAGASPQPISVSLTVNPAPLPVVQSVTSSASYASGTVAPGELVTIFGSNIGPASLTVPPSGSVPTSLAGTAVTFDGIPAPIYYASATQTSVQVPYGIANGQTVMRVTYNTAVSLATPLRSTPAFPGLFTADSSGQHQAAALNGNLSVNTASNPAVKGGAVVLYGTGEGQTSPPVVEGTKVPLVAPFPQTPYPVTVTIGGQTASVLYAGETPGLLSGLFQINVAIPATAPSGPAVPVVVFVNGQQTQANVTIAIQ